MGQGPNARIVYLGPIYINTDMCWTYLNNAAKDAAHLGLVPLNAFTDRRNPDPIIYQQQPQRVFFDGVYGEYPEVLKQSFNLPTLPHYGPITSGIVPQPYHVEIWIEKSTMNDILAPIAARYHINVVPFVGEATATACRNLINRIRHRNLAVRVLYLSDFDPGAKGMPVAAARKIEFELHKQGLIGNRDVQVRPIMLTLEQCVEYQLPRIPIKDSEQRAARFEERYGEGATELDALEALHPGVFGRIVRTEIQRYRNPDHDAEVRDQLNAFRNDMRSIEQEVYTEHRTEIEGFEADVEALNDQLEALNQQAAEMRERMEPTWQAMQDKLRARQPDVEVERPEFDADEDDNPLFDSSRSYVEQVGVYKRHQGRPTERRRRTARAPRRQAPQQPYRPIRVGGPSPGLQGGAS